MGIERTGLARKHHDALWIAPLDYQEPLSQACYFLCGNKQLRDSRDQRTEKQSGRASADRFDGAQILSSAIDGLMGNAPRGALMAFQMDSAFTVNGRMGTATLNALGIGSHNSSE